MADFDFFETFGMTMAAGRGFAVDFPADEFFFPNAEKPVSRGGIVINEAAARRAGWTDPADAIGKVMQGGFNFNDVDLQVLQQTQRSIPGAEVVDGNPNTHGS